MDIIDSNVVINISVKKTQSDLGGILGQINELMIALDKLSGKTPSLSVNIQKEDLRRVRSMAKALGQIKELSGDVGVKSTSKVLGISSQEVAALSTNLGVVAEQVRKIRSADLNALAPKEGTGGRARDLAVPDSARQVDIKDIRRYDEEGKEDKDKRTRVEKYSDVSINGVLETRVQIQQKITAEGVKQTEQLTTVLNLEKELASKQARRSLQDQMKGQDIEKNQADAQKRIDAWKKEGFVEDPFKTRRNETMINGKRVQYATRTLVKDLGQGLDSVIKINEATNLMTGGWARNTEKLKAFKAGLAEVEKAARKVREQTQKTQTLAEFRQENEAGGWSQGGTRRRIDTQTGVTTDTQTYYKTQRLGLARYNVQLREYNSLTGISNQRTLKAAEAARFLGDSIFRAGEKVFIWTVSTTILFSAIRAVRSLAKEVIELETSAILLTRVADKLVSSFGISGNAFALKRQIAERLTNQFIVLAQAIGGSATEAQAAGAVFLRAGQTEREVIMSVTASLLAARIAELNVAEAANLMVSALLQFNMQAEMLLPTLDSLNTLSNNYKVTTQDLLESISRAGSVYAAHNGKIEELAGFTAVIAEVTSRTGTQIGNALKTIQSRLDRVEVKKNIFQQLQISTSDMEGRARSLGDLLLQLKIRLEGLSEAEQNELTIQAAGVRQRAVMVSAIDTADKGLLAYTKALMESGSASAEFEEQAGTIAAALERIKGSFSAIAKTLEGPLGGTMKVIVNLTDGVLRLINKLGGIPLKMAGYAAVFGILRFSLVQLHTRALPKLTVAYAASTLATKDFLISTGAVPFAAGKAAYSVNTLSGTLVAGTFAAGAFGKALILALGPLNIITGAVIIGAVVLSELIGRTVSAIEATESYTNAISTQIAAEEKRSVALVNTVNNVMRLTNEIHRLNIATEESGKDDGKYLERIKSLQEMADAQLRSVGMSPIEFTDKSGKLKPGAVAELTTKGLKREQDDFKARRKTLLMQEDNFNKQLDKERATSRGIGPIHTYDYTKPKWGGFHLDREKITNMDEFNAYSKKLATLAEEVRRYELKLRGMTFLERVAESYRIDSKIRSTNREKWIASGADGAVSRSEGLEGRYEDWIESQAALEELRKEIKKVTEKIKELDSTILDADAIMKLEDVIYAATNGAGGLFRELNKLNNLTRAEKMSGYSLPYEDNIEKLKEMSDEIIRLKDNTEEWIHLSKGVSTETLDEYVKILEKAGEKVDDLIAKRRKLVRKEVGDFRTSQFKMRDQLYEAFATSKEGTASSHKLLSETFGLAAIEGHMGRIRDRIVAARKDVALMTMKPVAGMLIDAQAALRDLVDNGGSSDAIRRGENAVKKAQEFRDQEGDRLSSQAYIQEQLLKLRDLEISKAITLEKAEAQIAESRKKAADEAARSLGLLSGQDRLRVIAQAQYFREHPDKKIGLPEIMRSTAGGFKTTNRFFGSNVRGFDANGSLLESMLAEAGFGMTPEIVNSQERLAISTDANVVALDRLNESFARSIDFDAQSRISGGQSAIMDARRISGVEVDGDSNGQFNINIQRGAIDFSGFSEDFIGLIRPMVRDAVQEMVEHIEMTRPPEAPRKGIKAAE